jgi:hypothetical protein
MDARPTFEETYPKHEFSELVRLGLAMAAWLSRMRLRAKAPPPAPVAENEVGAA